MSRWPTREGHHGDYAGMCVGGPNDGMFLSSHTPTHRGVVLPKVGVTPYNTPLPPGNVRVETFVYQWVEGLKGPNAIDFFVPEGKTKEDALAMIFQEYAKRG